MKITYPINAALPGGALHNLDYELRMNSSLTIQKSGSNIEIINGNITLSISQVDEILASGGEVENYVMVTKAPLSGLNVDVPEGLPDRTKPTAAGTSVRKIGEWLTPNNVWIGETHFYFLSINIAGTYLKGSEIAILDAVTGVSILLTSDQEFIDIQNA